MIGLIAAPTLAQEYPRRPSTSVAPQQPARPPVTVKCPTGRSYRLSTGSDGGVCKIYVERGKVTGGFCTDGSNSVLQTCSTGCKEMTGSGACAEIDPTATDDATLN